MQLQLFLFIKFYLEGYLNFNNKKKRKVKAVQIHIKVGQHQIDLELKPKLWL